MYVTYIIGDSINYNHICHSGVAVDFSAAHLEMPDTDRKKNLSEQRNVLGNLNSPFEFLVTMSNIERNTKLESTG